MPLPALLAAVGPAMKIAGAVSGIAGNLFKGIFGSKQLREAKKINPVRPTLNIKETFAGAHQNRDMYANAMRGEMPGADAARKTMLAGQAGLNDAAARGATDQSAYLASITAGNEQVVQGSNNLAVQEAIRAEGLMGGLAGANSQLDEARQMDFQINKMDPYLLEMKKKQDLLQSGSSNTFGGIMGGAGSLMQAGSMLSGMQGGGSSSGGNVSGAAGFLGPLGSIFKK
jgi:hypothetical protein